MSALQIKLFGLAGLAFAVYGLWGTFYAADQLFPAICLRAGLVILAIWLALPQLVAPGKKSFSGLTLVAIIAIIAVVSSRPRIFLLVAGIGILILILQRLKKFSAKKIS